VSQRFDRCCVSRKFMPDLTYMDPQYEVARQVCGSKIVVARLAIPGGMRPYAAEDSG